MHRRWGSRRLLVLGATAVTLAALGYGFAQRSDTAGGGVARAQAGAESNAPALVDIPNACLTGGALAGGQPTPEQLEQARERGFRTVISMQPMNEPGVRELDRAADELGLTYIALPVRGASDLTRENAEAFAEALEDAEPDVMVHCASGNRVGAMYALKAYYVDGEDADAALDTGLESGMTQLEGDVRQILGLD